MRTAIVVTASVTSAVCGSRASTPPRVPRACPTARSSTVCSWPASSWTARSWPTSPCETPRPSADSSSAPARPRRPSHTCTTAEPSQGAPPSGAAPFFVPPMEITSSHNEALKEVRKLAGRRWRDKLGSFVAEGEDLLEAADAAGWHASARYAAKGSGLDGIPVLPHVLAEVSQLGSGTRAMAVYPQRWSAPVGPLCVALWGVGDPGNVGTVIRSALAFGASSVALGPGSADPFGHKAVRASMGALFSVPVARVRTPSELPGRKIALVAREGEPLHALEPGEITLVVGAEREGVPADVIAACDGVAHIPIAHADSLNAAMAATVSLYQLSRISRP